MSAMSKPYGYYLDPVLDRLKGVGPVKDWLLCTVVFTSLAMVVGWMLSAPLIVWLFVPGFDEDGDFGWVYVVAVLAWVVPSSTWAGWRIHRDWSRGVGPYRTAHLGEEDT